MPIENVRHQREPLPGQIVAQVRARAPLAVDVGPRLDRVRAVHGTGVNVHLVGRCELLPGTSAPVAHPRPARIDVLVDGLGRIHCGDHLDGAVGTGYGGGGCGLT